MKKLFIRVFFFKPFMAENILFFSLFFIKVFIVQDFADFIDFTIGYEFFWPTKQQRQDEA